MQNYVLISSFQYKIIYNNLFLNQELCLFGITESPQFFYCNSCEDASLYLLYERDSTKYK